MIRIRRHLYLVGTLGLAAATGCSVADNEPQPAASQGGEATPSEPGQANASASPSDPQILFILSTVDSAEIEQAQLALNKAQSPRVREFASSMIQQHTASREEGAQIASTNSLTPESSPAAAELQQKAAQTLNKLSAVEPSAFDRQYMQVQVEQHGEVLNMLKTRLIPAADTEALAHQLRATQEMVQMHHKHAQELATTLQ
jgi:putative membrane protein